MGRWAVVRNLAWWGCVSLVAMAALQANALLGLAVAVVGGVVLGILLFR